MERSLDTKGQEMMVIKVEIMPICYTVYYCLVPFTMEKVEKVCFIDKNRFYYSCYPQNPLLWLDLPAS